MKPTTIRTGRRRTWRQNQKRLQKGAECAPDGARNGLWCRVDLHPIARAAGSQGAGVGPAHPAKKDLHLQRWRVHILLLRNLLLDDPLLQQPARDRLDLDFIEQGRIPFDLDLLPSRLQLSHERRDLLRL